MSDSTIVAKQTPKKAKKPTKKVDHPPVAEMVMAAVSNLKDRKGSSLIAIKKYIASHYKVDAAKLAPFIRRFLKKAVEDGKIAQTKGTGASGSFKIGAKPEKPKKVKKPKAAKKEKKAKKPKATTPKKPKAKKATKSPKKVTKKPVKKAVAKPAKKATKSPKKAAKKVTKKPAKK